MTTNLNSECVAQALNNKPMSPPVKVRQFHFIYTCSTEREGQALRLRFRNGKIPFSYHCVPLVKLILEVGDSPSQSKKRTTIFNIVFLTGFNTIGYGM